MADSSAAKPQKRLSVWAATEPLPAPLPPPPRVQRVDAPSDHPVTLHSAHQLPPIPHISTPNLDVSAAHEPDSTSNRQPPLRVPSVIASLAITVVLLAGVGWLQMQQPQELDWPTVKSIALGQRIEPVTPESELPYVTVMPLVPNCDGNIVRRDRNRRPAARVTMSDIKQDTPDTDLATETQRR